MDDTPTGRLITLHDGVVTATIAPVGAALRGLTVDGVRVVPDYPHDVPAPGCAGTVLVPWPNRIRDGRWDDGRQQLAITEPKYGNASHGLLRYTEYAVASRSDASVTLAADVYPQLGYPFWLRTRVTHAVEAAGVTVTHEVQNVGSASAPVGIGVHPYLTIDDPESPVSADDILVRVPAAEYYLTDDRMLPTGVAPVAGTHADVRDYRPLSQLTLDTGYRATAAASGSRFESVLKAPNGSTVGLWQDASFGYVQVYTKPDFPGIDGPLATIAIEPMTCAADAFNSGDGLRFLEPGDTFTARWGITFAR
ncbi:MAG: aldose 1-epimerase family protein [Gordonia sp. (in: high G+C Gram-positive bacteria)]|uniref:aldose 1-epimerase family protein n=1 Tax=Gordonia sp. (in: high G+C Gram-positive bacteria) TaxID=84139 RepID=UPI0039E35B89